LIFYVTLPFIPSHKGREKPSFTGFTHIRANLRFDSAHRPEEFEGKIRHHM
jgi:hypothetical protein